MITSSLRVVTVLKKVITSILAITLLFTGLMIFSSRVYAAPFITGTVYGNDDITPVGSGRTVRLLVNGVDSALTGDTDGSGDYSIDLAGGGIYSPGDVLTLYIDGETERGVAVTIGATADTAIAGLDIYRSGLAISSQNAIAVTNTMLDTANNGDTDITDIYSDLGTTTLTMGYRQITLESGSTYAPGGDITTTGEVYMLGTYTAGTETLTFSDGDGPFDPGAGNTYNNVVNLGGEPFELINNTLSTSNFTNDGDFDLNGNDLTVTGTYVNTGYMAAYGDQTMTIAGTPNGGNWRFYGDSDGSQETFDISSFFTIYDDLEIGDNDAALATMDVYEITSAITVNGDFELDEGTFDTNDNAADFNGDVDIDDPDTSFLAGSSNITVAGDWYQSHVPGFTPNTSTITFDGDDQYIEESINFCNLVFIDPTNNATSSFKTIEENVTITVLTGCTFTATGTDSDDNVAIDSGSAGVQATINVVDGVSAVTANDVTVTDNNLQYNGTTAAPGFGPANSTDSGNADGWFVLVRSLTYDANDTYEEVSANNGFLEANQCPLIVSVSNDTFNDLGTGKLTSSQVTIANNPTGLTPELTIAGGLPNNWNDAGTNSGSNFRNAIGAGAVNFVSLEQNSTNARYSPDGITWTSVTLPISATWRDVTYGNGTFVAVGGTAIIYSTNEGVSWSSAVSDGNFRDEVEFGNGKFVTVSTNGSNQVLHSPDGITWTSAVGAYADGTSHDVLGYGNGKFVALINGTDDGMYSTDDGVTWTAMTLPASDSWSGMAYGNGTFVAINFNGGSTGNAIYSTDGITWTSSTSMDDGQWDDVIYVDGGFIAVSTNDSNPSISYDGMDWFRPKNTYDLTASSRKITHKDGVFVHSAYGTNQHGYSSSNPFGSEVSLQFADDANDHALSDSVANLTFTFADTAFTGGDADSVANSGTSTPQASGAGIEFDDPATLIYSKPVSIGPIQDTLDVSSDIDYPSDILFNSDGTKMYVSDSDNEYIFQYDLSTAYDITTASSSGFLDTDDEDDSPEGIVFNDDGTKMFMVGSDDSDEMHEYALSSAYDITTATHTITVDYEALTNIEYAQGITFNNDGTKLFTSNTDDYEIVEYTLSTPYDISTLTHVATLFVEYTTEYPVGIVFNTAGTKMIVVDEDNNSIVLYELSTAFSILTATYKATHVLDEDDSEYPNGVFMSSDESSIYIANEDNVSIDRYDFDFDMDVNFVELSSDNGSIDNEQPLIITLTDGDFNDLGSGYLTAAQVTVGNVPPGLTAEVYIEDDEVLEVTLIASSTLHTDTQDVTSLTFVFTDLAFEDASSTDVVNSGFSGAYSPGIGVDFDYLFDADGDGNPDSIEDGGFNGGDGNGDGIPDSTQTNVAGAPNPATGAYTTLETSGTCTPISANEFLEESDLTKEDPDATYPVGLIDFQLNCASSGQSATVVQYYDKIYDTSEWSYKKFNSSGEAYSDISDLVTYGTYTHTTGVASGTPVTTVTFTVTDGDVRTDEDGISNGVINDPSGPAIVSVTPVTTSTSKSSGGGGSRRKNTTPDTTIAVTESGYQVCEPYIKENIKLGAVNNPIEVNKLITFLNDKQGESLSLDGSYDQDDFEAVKRFQTKYSDAILSIWGLTEPTGWVYKTTKLKINSFYCNQAISCPAFTEYNELATEQNLYTPEVQRTKGLLADLGFYSGIIDKSYNQSFHQSMVNFQEEFSATMLTPWGLTRGTGYKYKTTNKFLNFLVGCETGAVDLDGKGTFDY